MLLRPREPNWLERLRAGGEAFEGGASEVFQAGGRGRGLKEGGEFAAGVHQARVIKDSGAKAAGGGNPGNAQRGVDVREEAFEVPVGMQKSRKTAAGGNALGGGTGRQVAVGGCAGQEPFEGNALVQGEQRAQAYGEEFVAHEGAVAERNAVVFEPALDAAPPADEAACASGAGGILVAGIERGGEVGQPGTETQADEQGTWACNGVVGQFLGGGRAAHGG